MFIHAPHSPALHKANGPTKDPLRQLALTEHQSQEQQEQQNYRSVIKAESLTRGPVGLTLPLKWSVVEESGEPGRTRHRPVPTTSKASSRYAQGSAVNAARSSQTNSDRSTETLEQEQIAIVSTHRGEQQIAIVSTIAQNNR